MAGLFVGWDAIMAIEINKGVASVPISSATSVKTAEAAPRVQARQPVQLTTDPAQNQKALKEALAQVNKQMADNKQSLGFSHDDSIHGPVIVVTNSQTGEVVRKIPTEEVIRVAHNIDALKGVLFSSKI
jgi:flagellar protein FlaG